MSVRRTQAGVCEHAPRRDTEDKHIWEMGWRGRGRGGEGRGGAATIFTVNVIVLCGGDLYESRNIYRSRFSFYHNVNIYDHNV